VTAWGLAVTDSDRAYHGYSVALVGSPSVCHAIGSDHRVYQTALALSISTFGLAHSSEPGNIAAWTPNGAVQFCVDHIGISIAATRLPGVDARPLIGTLSALCWCIWAIREC